MFYCFVCHERATSTPLHEKLGMDYPRGARSGAAGRDHHPRALRPDRPDPREPLYAAVATAADWFARQLRESPEAEIARKYSSRGMSRWNRRRLGAWDSTQGHAFLDAMKALGLREEVFARAGLLVKRDDGRRVRVSEAGCFSNSMNCVREW